MYGAGFHIAYMSLKAKIEAVIYAAEEPVTLAQLTALFQAEALEERRVRLAEQAVEAAAAMSVGVDTRLGMGTPADCPLRHRRGKRR